MTGSEKRTKADGSGEQNARVGSCGACGTGVYRDEDEVPIGYRDNSPDGHEAVNILLCEACRFGVVQELLSGNWEMSAHRVERAADTDDGPEGNE